MTLAIFGGSCTGKTTFVKYLSNKYDLPFRHCGEAIRLAAKAEGVALSGLSNETHVRVDHETGRWVRTQKSPKVLEGRFLNYVLAENTSDVTLVHFVANAEVRSERLHSHNAADDALHSILRSDSFDFGFCARLYGGVAPLATDLTIDTSCLSMGGIEDYVKGALK